MASTRLAPSIDDVGEMGSYLRLYERSLRAATRLRRPSTSSGRYSLPPLSPVTPVTGVTDTEPWSDSSDESTRHSTSARTRATTTRTNDEKPRLPRPLPSRYRAGHRRRPQRHRRGVPLALSLPVIGDTA
jgi:hypothetical protein